MAKIIAINGGEVKIGEDNGHVVTVPAMSIQYTGAKVDDEVILYRDGENFIVKAKNTAETQVSTVSNQSANIPEGYKSIDKNMFVWLFSFLLGNVGVDRFVRGQIGTGVCKLLFGWCTLGIWALVDWIIAMTKAYGSAFGNSSELLFNEKGKYIR